jgi:hypothetical protein
MPLAHWCHEPTPALLDSCRLCSVGRCRDVDDDLARSVTFLHVPDGRGDFAQRIRPIDDRCHLAGLDELGEDGKVFCIL